MGSEVSKRKVVVPTTTITSSCTIRTSILLENANLKQLIKFKQINDAYNPVYERIQKFMSDVSYLLLLSTFCIAIYIIENFWLIYFAL
ncbi:MAG TPA: hypothetical protein VEQ18_05485, partial [Candidatus Nitrosocosmicus sp.]|nr:hypothetical protein [Candidatus Nitrosocosmicus sp.]